MRALSVLAVLLTLTACDSSSGVVEADSEVTVAYEGRLQDGRVFDSSERATFSLRNVIPGFRKGMLGMAVGETRTFSIPPEEGYGDEPQRDRAGNVVIPANSTLIFEVTLLDLE